MEIVPPAARELQGDEPFAGVDATVRDFWRFAMGDLRTNNVRGYLAEFLVARAVGASGARVEWDPWDVTAPDGTKIEVKASGYLQSWAQRKVSTPSFQVAPAYGWDVASGARAREQGYHADVYVFCLHTARSHDNYDPLSTTQWVFYVAPRSRVQSRAGVRMGLVALTELAGDPVAYDNLRDAIRAASHSESS
ncbi:hypothetical protein GCM10028777_16080 [Angustibacter speluncae]